MSEDKWSGLKYPFDSSSFLGKKGRVGSFRTVPSVARISSEEPKKPESVGWVELSTPLAIDPEQATQFFPFAKSLRIADGSQYILDENGKTILLFTEREAGGFRKVYSPRDPREVTREILGLPEEQQQTLIEQLHLPEPVEADIQAFAEKIRVVQEEENILNSALALPLRTTEAKSRRPSYSRGIIQQEYGITDARSSEPAVGTYGLGPCIALVIHDRGTETAAVAHIDAMTTIESIGRMLYQIGGDRTQWEIGLVGGDTSSRRTVLNILQYLQKQGLAPTYADIMSKPHPTAFVIDSRTGEIIPNVHPSNPGENENLRMQMTGLNPHPQLKEEFDGRGK